MSLRDPRESCSRDVLVYPADGESPYIKSMVFNEAGADHPNGFYTTAVDLRKIYGKFIRQTLVQRFSVMRNESTMAKNEHGDYIIYFNMNLGLPLNLSIAKLLDINPKRPGPRPTWRGDVVVVRHQPWPRQITDKVPPRDWLNIHANVKGTVDRGFKDWYMSDSWATRIEDEKRWADEMRRVENPDPSDLQAIYYRKQLDMLEGLQNRVGLDRFKYVDMPNPKNIDKTQKVKDQRRMDRTWDKLEKNKEKQAVLEAKNQCKTCNVSAADLKVCQRCKKAKYCGRDCQTRDWKRHKLECKELQHPET